MSPMSVGNLVAIAPLIDSSLAAPLTGWTADDLGQAMTVCQIGAYEPEFRLVITVPFLITMVIGSFGLDMTIDNRLKPITYGVFPDVLGFAVGTGAAALLSYSNDVCQHRAGEALGIAMVCPGIFQ